MSSFERVCRNSSKNLSAYTREHCIKLGLMNRPKKQSDSLNSRKHLNPVHRTLNAKRVDNLMNRNVEMIPNGRGGWKQANNGKSKKKTPTLKSLNKVNQIGKKAMKCDCKKDHNENGQKYCRCNIPDMPHVHKRWIATNFKM